MVAVDPASGRAWHDLVDQTAMLRDHLDYLRERDHPLPGDPQLIAAAIGAMLAMLSYARPTSEEHIVDDYVAEALTDLLLHGLAGPQLWQRGVGSSERLLRT